ncbi:hypothetical protein PpBr36_08192 [Pyricularia pennisetigena]|uniref:hypothetical protein n=1 Tax=Pyricularia pennisetigena TaxID=1578925 RepID=UPI001150AE4B|nr:hypothetical protein PpBr36_08192 [Pyricularia pennisetigena]TLS23878.1 hypothetical protein PpBr36_08192 [Pyricularia pennisetigena]
MRVATHPPSDLSKPDRNVLSHLLLLRLIHLGMSPVYLRLGGMHARAASHWIPPCWCRGDGCSITVVALLLLLRRRTAICSWGSIRPSAPTTPIVTSGASPGEAGAAVMAMALASLPALLTRRGLHKMQLVPQWWC